MVFQAVAVVTDLIFSSKIVGTAEQLGVCARAVATPAALEETLSQGGVRLVMLDMSLPREVAVPCLEQAAAYQPPLTTVAFFSHVDGALKTAAKEAGATLVMPRSEFATRLPAILRDCATATTSVDEVNG